MLAITLAVQFLDETYSGASQAIGHCFPEQDSEVQIDDNSSLLLPFQDLLNFIRQ